MINNKNKKVTKNSVRTLFTTLVTRYLKKMKNEKMLRIHERFVSVPREMHKMRA